MPTSYKYKLTLLHEADTYEIAPEVAEKTPYEVQILLGTYIKGDTGPQGPEGPQGPPVPIADNLTTNDPNMALSARQGKILNETKVEATDILAPVEEVPSNYYTKSETATYVAAQTAAFITKSVNNLTNYYLKSDTYTKAEVQALIGAINQFHFEIYASLADVTDPAGNVLYLIGPTGTGSDKYEEYVYANGQFVKIGDTSIDLSGYVTTDALNAALANYYQKPEDGIPESDLSNAVATKLNATEIFWATYGTTTAAEIDAAVAAGKAVMCYYNSRVYYLALYSPTAATLYFGSAFSTSGGYAGLSRSTNSWTYGNPTLEGVSNKLASLSDLITNRTSTTKYPSAKATFDGLGQYGVISQTQTWSGSGSNPRTYTMSDLVYGLIPQANIDLFTAAGATFNATTGYFELNGLTDISYEEMRAIYDAGSPSFVGNIGLYGGKAVRTNRPLNSTLLYTNTSAVTATRMGYASNIEVLICKINGDNAADHLIFTTTLAYAFTNAYFLKKIDGFGLTSTISSQSYTSAFSKCYSLESIRLARLGATVSFSNSSLLDLASVVYMVDNAINTSAITITLHATAYARCQADTTEYTYSGQTYTGILAYASAKNITIAS